MSYFRCKWMYSVNKQFFLIAKTTSKWFYFTTQVSDVTLKWTIPSISASAFFFCFSFHFLLSIHLCKRGKLFKTALEIWGHQLLPLIIHFMFIVIIFSYCNFRNSIKAYYFLIRQTSILQEWFIVIDLF